MPRGMKPVKKMPSVEASAFTAPNVQSYPPEVLQYQRTYAQPTEQIPSPPVPQLANPTVATPKRDREVYTLRDLPSKFKGYGGLDYIEIRAFTLGELKYLSSGLTDTQVIGAFRNAILNMDAAELSYQDFMFISSHINLVTSIDQEWTLNIECHKCGHEFTLNTARDGLFKFEELNIPDLPIIVEFKGVEMHFDIPRLKDTLTAQALKKKFPKASDEIISLASQVRNLPPETAFTVLNGITDFDDIQLIEEIQGLMYHGVLPLEAECPECKFKGKYQVGQGVSTIKPFRKDREPLSNRIKYGSSSKS